MHLTDAEKEQRERFAGFYQRNQLPVMRRIERSVCGCDFGGTSWTTRGEADAVASSLELDTGRELLELGAGSGWPGLYLARLSGCDITLLDLPPEGLAIAAGRAATEALSGRYQSVAANAAQLPFDNNRFDAISHSDLLCCMPAKQQALDECRRVLKTGGKMVFSVISVTPGLSAADEARACDAGPQFISTDSDYSDMLVEADWEISQTTDLTPQFRTSTEGFLVADEANKAEFIDLLGEENWLWRQSKNAGLIEVIDEGLLRRDLYEVRPV
jgi:ubiquinone/menaquinone biosynthesis C-methylase UbiE